MKMFLSAVETNPPQFKEVVDMGYKPLWNLMSYFYVKGRDDVFNYVCDHSELVEIDSGGHSFHGGIRVNFDEYCKQYGEWIKAHDRDNILGFFELDIEKIVGFDKVREYYNYLKTCSDKIIPVWHKERGIDEFKRMCKEAGKSSYNVVAIGGLANTEVKDFQYGMFLKYAWDNGCRVHCLGMTRKSVIDRIPFDFVDSSSWKTGMMYGKMEGISKKVPHPKNGSMRLYYPQSYIQWMDVQRKYFEKWRGVAPN